MISEVTCVKTNNTTHNINPESPFLEFQHLLPINTKETFNNKWSQTSSVLSLKGNLQELPPITTSIIEPLRGLHINTRNITIMHANELVFFTNSSIYFHNHTMSHFFTKIIDFQSYDSYLGVLTEENAYLFQYNGLFRWIISKNSTYDRLSIGDFNNDNLIEMIIYAYNSNKLIIFSNYGGMLSSGEIGIVIDQRNNVISSQPRNIFVRKIICFNDKPFLLFRIKRNSEYYDWIGYINDIEENDGNYTLVGLRYFDEAYNLLVGSYKGQNALLVFFLNTTYWNIRAGYYNETGRTYMERDYGTRLYYIEGIMKNGNYWSILEDITGDGVSETVISNGTHIGVLYSGYWKGKNETIEAIQNTKAFAVTDKIVYINSTHLIILNATLHLLSAFRFPAVDFSASSSKVYAVSLNGTLMRIDVSSSEYITDKIPYISDKFGYDSSLNGLVVYNDRILYAYWYSYGPLEIRYKESIIDHVIISEHSLAVFLTNGTLIIYDAKGNIISKISSNDIELVAYYPQLNKYYLAFSNGTIKDSARNSVLIIGETPVFLDIVNDSLVYLSQHYSSPTLLAKVRKIDPETLGIIGEREVTLSHDSQETAVHYKAQIAFNDIDGDGYIDAGVFCYIIANFTLPPNYIFLNVRSNITILSNITGNVIKKYSSVRGLDEVIHYYIDSLGNGFFVFEDYGLSNNTYIYRDRDGSITKTSWVFENEAFKTATCFGLLSNTTIRFYYNYSFTHNRTIHLPSPKASISRKYPDKVIIDFISGAAIFTMSIVNDTEAPYAEILEPEFNTQINAYVPARNPFQLVINMSDDLMLKNFSLEIDSSILSTGNLVTDNMLLNVSLTLTGGYHDGLLVVYDVVNRSYNLAFDIYIDTEPPQITISVPQVTNSTNVSVGASANDTLDIAWIAVIIDGELKENRSDTSNVQLNVILDEGSHEVRVKAADTMGNLGEKTTSVRVDLTPANIIVVSPKNNTYVNTGSIFFNITFSDDVDIDIVEVWKNDTKILSEKLSRLETQIELETDGVYIFTIAVKDVAGNMNRTVIYVYRDTRAPDIFIVAPQNNTYTNQDKVRINATFSDEFALENITIYLNNSKVISGVFLSIESDIILAEDGKYNITIIAIDKAGNLNKSLILITRDTVPPDITIILPENNTIINESEIELHALVSDDNSLKNVSIWLNDTLVYQGENGDIIISINPGRDGFFAITIISFDVAGNEKSVVLYVIRDTTPPSFEVTSPEYGEFINDRSVNVTLILHDMDGSRIDIYINGSLYTEIRPNNSKISFYINLTEDGLYALKVVVMDYAGNEAESTVVFTIDTLSPRISIITPSNNSKVEKDEVNIAWDVFDENDIVSIELYVNGTLEYQTTEVSGNYTVTFKESGVYIITIKACDVAGNYGEVKVIIEVSLEEESSSPTEFDVVTLLTGVALGTLGWLSGGLVAVIITRRRRMRFLYHQP